MVKVLTTQVRMHPVVSQNHNYVQGSLKSTSFSHGKYSKAKSEIRNWKVEWQKIQKYRSYKSVQSMIDKGMKSKRKYDSQLGSPLILFMVYAGLLFRLYFLKHPPHEIQKWSRT